MAAFEFLTRTPEPPLRRFVELLWHARGTVRYTRERIAPTGSCVAVFVLGDPIVQTPDDGSGEPLRAEHGVLAGPHDRPILNEPTGETFAVGIVTTTIGCEAVFGIPPAQLRGKAADLAATWPVATELRCDLLACKKPHDRLALLERRLHALHDASIAGLARCERATALLEADPTRPIADIARELGISHGHLDRELTRVVGLTPRVLARLLRLRRLVNRIDVHADVPWMELAGELGWSDQSHLIRDFKRHTGVSPSRYVAAQRAAYSPAETREASGFVPEP